MQRVTRDGKTINKRTDDMLNRAEQRLGFKLYVVQGSYNAGGVAASGGTHDGGGAVDLSPTAKPHEVVRQLRHVGFAAWYRTPAQGPWSAHIHAIAIGDADLSSGARSQVQAYYGGRNGLANNAPDDGPRLNPIPTWPVKLGTVFYPTVKWQFTKKKPNSKTAVKHVQRLLNYRLGLNLKVDGVAGNVTRDAYKKWQHKIDSATRDGRPNPGSLGRLLAGYYRLGFRTTK